MEHDQKLIEQIGNILDPVNPESRMRVLNYLTDYYEGVEVGSRAEEFVQGMSSAFCEAILEQLEKIVDQRDDDPADFWKRQNRRKRREEKEDHDDIDDGEPLDE